MKICGYTISDKLSESDRTLVYRGVHLQTGQSAVLKLPKSNYPTPAEIGRIRHEYEICRIFNHNKIISVQGIEEHERSLVLILEDFDGHALSGARRTGNQDLIWFLDIAIQLTDALREIHNHHVIYKNLCPANILYRSITGRIKLVDFSIASTRDEEFPLYSSALIPEGTLYYISPEQTGRIDKPLDYRTDFYSLGATLYELLTNKLPFSSRDPIEQLHCHLARKPVPPIEYDSSIPRSVSDIVMKLLEKSAERRYQSCNGLIPDLMRCLIELKDTRSIVDFSIGRKDITAEFIIPDKLYGRKREMETIVSAYDKTCSGSKQVVFVSGHSGIGKTSLVEEVKRIIEARGGYILSGKTDMSRKDLPYASIIKLFKELVQKILLESSVQIRQWKHLLLQVLGDQAQVIIEVIPELQLILGPQPPVLELSPVENKNRFRRIFRSFVETCSEQAGTLVFFMDDLHWADQDTLELLEDMTLNIDMPGMLICSFRDDEADISPHFKETVKRISEGANSTFLKLASLSTNAIANLLSETFYTPIDSVLPLAKICLKKTAGNPFFLKQFLKELYESGHLVFNTDTGRWDIDSHFVKTMQVTPNVGVMLTQRITSLSQKARNIMQMAACIGNTFNLSILSGLNIKNQQQTLMELGQLIHEGLIIRISQPQESGPDQLQDEYFRFAHDQIQKAAYALIPPENLRDIHLKIGRLLLRVLPKTNKQEQLYDIVNHLNHGITLLPVGKERSELARLNLEAAIKSKKSAAYSYYYKFAKTSLELLPEDAWESLYDLALDVHTEVMEAASLNRHPEETDQYFDLINKHARDLLDKARAYRIRVKTYKAENRLEEAVEIGMKMLAELGVRFPDNPGRITILKAMLATRFMLLGKRPQDLSNLPIMTDPRRQAIMEFLLEIGTAAYYAKPALVPLIGFLAIRLSLRYGNHIVSTIMGYPTYGFLLCGIAGGNIQQGYEFGKLAVQLQKKLGHGENPLTTYLVNNLIIHWKKHINTTLPPLLESFKLSLNRGDLEYAANSAYCYCYRLLFLGRNLDSCDHELRAYREAIEPLEQKIPLYRHMLFQQVIANLREKSKNPGIVDGVFYNSKSLVPLHKKSHDNTTLFLNHLMNLVLSYHYGNYQTAEKQGEKALSKLNSAIASIFVPLYHFYSTLNFLALYPTRLELKNSGRLRAVRASIEKMRFWASMAPDNYRHKFHLMNAEYNHAIGNHERATENYDLAIRHARQAGYLQEEGLAFERAARCFLAINRSHIAKSYLNEALYCYKKWGANALIDHLVRLFADQKNEEEKTPLFTSSSRSESNLLPTDSSRYDVMSVIKASRTFTGEMILDELLKKLIAILLENAGGQTGFLLMEEHEEWIIKVKAEIGAAQGTVIDSPIESFNHQLSNTIVNYVIRSRKTVVLNNACEEGLFTTDNYILLNKPKSVLCMPILHQNEVICLIYLENNLTTGAFHAEKLELLNLLASQAAISIRNSRLYEELDGTVKELHHEVAKRKETQIQLLHAGKLSALGRLSASIAHEFGNPLIGIKYLLDDLRNRSELATEDKHLINVGLEECERMRSLINDLHDLHRPSSGTKKRFNLNDTVRNALLFQRKNFKNVGISVSTDLDQNLPDILAVEDQITQVIVNLAINAADSMAKTGGTLTARTSYQEDHITLDISDTGCGIQEEHQEHIFEPFFSTKQEVDGTGLGLAIAYSIVKNHNGTISFVSETGRGSTFTLRLPWLEPNDDTPLNASPQADHLPAQ